MPQGQVKDLQEKHVIVFRRHAENFVNQNVPLPLVEDSLEEASGTGRRKGRRRGKRKKVENLEVGKVDSSVSCLPSNKSIAFQRRPGFGKLGNKCVVKANHFLAKMPESDLSHYNVTINPKCISSKTNREIMSLLIKLHRDSYLGMRLPIYDGRRSLYVAGQLPFTSKDFTIVLADGDERSSSLRK